MLPVIGGVFRCTFRYTAIAGLPLAVNVMHFYKAGGTAAALWTALDAHSSANMRACMENSTGVDFVDITPLDGGTVTETHATGAASKWYGTQSSSQITPQVAAIVKLKTDVRGRSYRGRAFLPWVVESAMNQGVLDSTIKSSMQSAWNTWLSAMQGDNYYPVVASYKLATKSDITSIEIENYLGTQRRRQPRP
jgi:hypothetical protein